MKKRLGAVYAGTPCMAGYKKEAVSDNVKGKSNTAVLVVSFGTSYNESRQAAIEAVEKAIGKACPDYGVRRAFTSQVIIDKLKDRDGLKIDNVKEALDRAAEDGVVNLVVQPTHLMDGYEYMDLADALKDYESRFEKIVLGEPLLSGKEDFAGVVKAITEKTSGYDNGETAVCFMGHGTGADSNKVYGQMQEELKTAGYENYYIGTVEAEPALVDVMAMLKEKGTYKKVVLEPLMVVAGDHANNDMAGDKEDSWKTILENEGYEVECILEGLGQIPAIQDIYVKHTQAAADSLHSSVAWEDAADEREVNTSEVIMIQGTMSGAGKSLLVAGLCRIMKQDGYRAAPFKSQNMALNSFVTEEGLEMGRAQVMQAEAAGIKPLVCMNPVLLKPASHTGAQVIVNGKVLGNMSAREYFSYKKELIPDIKKAFGKLEEMADIIVIEGAGSPAEINLRENDIVNMGLAQIVDAPVILVGDIDRGGVFAQLLGTLMLLSDEERKRVKGLIINKFRGDKSLLDSGIEILEEKGGIPVIGVIPYMDISLEDEDSLTERFEKKVKGAIDIAVIRYPRISNFTDFNVFEQIPEAAVRYVDSADQLQRPDIIFLPGSKNTIGDLAWMRSGGLEEAVVKMAGKVPICGICGGYQMMGEWILDPEAREAGGAMKGMGLLPAVTEFRAQKIRRQVCGNVNELKGVFSALSGLEYTGYEIHMGQTKRVKDGRAGQGECMKSGCEDKTVFFCGNQKDVYGTYVHGIFDKAGMACSLVEALAERKGIRIENGMFEDYMDFKNRQYDQLADTLREYLDMEEIYGILGEAHVQ